MDKNEMWWRFFVFHADQRLRAFNYYLIIVGALSLSYYFINRPGNDNIIKYSPFLCILMAVVSAGFFFLEIRNLQLVNTGRDELRSVMKHIEGSPEALRNSWGIFSYIIDVPPLNCERIKYFIKPFIKHQLWLRSIYLGVLLISVMLFYNKLTDDYRWLFLPFFVAYLSTLSRCDNKND